MNTSASLPPLQPLSPFAPLAPAATEPAATPAATPAADAPCPARPVSPEQWLHDYQRDDRRLAWLLRGIVAVALGLVLLSLATLTP